MISENQVHREFKRATNVFIYWNHSENIEMMIIDKADKVIIIVFGSLFSRYQTNLEKSIGDNRFIFNFDDLFSCRCQKINLKYKFFHLDKSQNSIDKSYQ